MKKIGIYKIILSMNNIKDKYKGIGLPYKIMIFDEKRKEKEYSECYKLDLLMFNNLLSLDTNEKLVEKDLITREIKKNNGIRLLPPKKYKKIIFNSTYFKINNEQKKS
jgi:hypothetical protein